MTLRNYINMFRKKTGVLNVAGGQFFCLTRASLLWYLMHLVTYNPAKMHFIDLFWPSKMTRFCDVDHKSLGIATSL